MVLLSLFFAINSIQQMLPTGLTHKDWKWCIFCAKSALCQFFEKVPEQISFLSFSAIIDDAEKLRELDHSWSILVHQLNHMLNFLCIVCQSETYQWFFHLVDPDRAWLIIIERVETLLEFQNFTCTSYEVKNLLILESKKMTTTCLTKPFSCLIFYNFLFASSKNLLPGFFVWQQFILQLKLKSYQNFDHYNLFHLLCS